MNIKEIKADLFNVNRNYTLVHCISYDCKMGQGIAVLFDKKFPQMKRMLMQGISVSNEPFKPMAIRYKDQNGCVINLITKEKYWHKPTYDTLQKSLQSLKDICITNNIDKLAMPLIGCGLDRLKWDKVKDIIAETFSDTDIEILVCKL